MYQVPARKGYKENGFASDLNEYLERRKVAAVISAGDMKNTSQNVDFSHFVRNVTLRHKRYSLANAGYITDCIIFDSITQ